MSEIIFNIAVFDPGGSFLGASERRLSDLSEKWVSIAEDYLRANGDVFDMPWKGPLSHLTTKLTALDGVALVDFRVGNIFVVSIVLIFGSESEASDAILKMFVKSLRNVDAVKKLTEVQDPFERVFHIKARPLMVVVPWGDERVSEQDQALVQELALHLGAAFFTRESLKLQANSRAHGDA